MNSLLNACLSFVMLFGSLSAFAFQTPPNIPMQRGISVNMPVTSHAVTVPDADQLQAPVVVITQNGTVYFGTRSVTVSSLAEAVNEALVNQPAKTIYLKADARVPYESVIKVLDALRATRAEGVTLLTNQAGTPSGKLVAPEGLEMKMVTRASK